MNRIDAPAVDPDPDRQVVVFGDFGQAADLLPPGGVRLGVVQMPGIVADLVDVGGGLFGETVVLLQVDRKADVRLPAYFRRTIAAPAFSRRLTVSTVASMSVVLLAAID